MTQLARLAGQLVVCSQGNGGNLGREGPFGHWPFSCLGGRVRPPGGRALQSAHPVGPRIRRWRQGRIRAQYISLPRPWVGRPWHDPSARPGAERTLPERERNVGTRIRMMPMGLPRRLAVLTAVMAVLLVTGATEIALWWSGRTRLEDFRLETVALANTLASLLVRSAPRGDSASLAQGLEGWARHRSNDSQAIVYLVRGQHLAPVAASGASDTTPATHVPYAALAHRSTEVMLHQGTLPGWEVAVPLGMPRMFGVLDVRVSTQRLVDWARLERRRGYLLALISALLVALFVAVLTARWVGRPLAALGTAMAGAHGGATGAPAAPEIGPREFRELTRRYNRMREALSARERESAARGDAAHARGAGARARPARAHARDGRGVRARDRHAAQHRQRAPAAPARRLRSGSTTPRASSGCACCSRRWIGWRASCAPVSTAAPGRDHGPAPGPERDRRPHGAIPRAVVQRRGREGGARASTAGPPGPRHLRPGDGGADPAQPPQERRRSTAGRRHGDHRHRPRRPPRLHRCAGRRPRARCRSRVQPVPAIRDHQGAATAPVSASRSAGGSPACWAATWSTFPAPRGARWRLTLPIEELA